MKKSIFAITLGLVLALFPSIVLGAVWYVDIGNSGTQDGTGWATAFTSIQAGIDAAFNDSGGEVWVAEGTYPEAVTIKSNVMMYGGFAGSETLLAERDFTNHPTMIDASTAAAGSPAKHAVVMNGIVNARIDGFTVTGGVADSLSGSDRFGGGIYAYNLDATATIANCRIIGNTARYGGGIFAQISAVTIENCFIGRNSSLYAGGGIYINNGSTKVIDSIIVTNWSQTYGGGLYIASGSSELTNCVISGNESSSMAAGGYLENTSAILRNCTVSGNYAVNSTGGIYISGGTPVIANSTISGNTGTLGGGISFQNGSTSIFNTILHNNTPYGVYNRSSSGLVLKNSLFSGNDQGDYFWNFYDNNSGQTITQTYNGANEINLFAPDADFTYDGDPSFVTAASGTWTAAPVFDGATGRTTLTDASASFGAGNLVGQLIKVSPDWRFQSLIVANTDTSITVLGNVSTITGENDAYQVIDYHLGPGSAAVDRGDVAHAPAEDFEGDPRPGTDSLVDIGIDEADPGYTPPADISAPMSFVEQGPSLVAGTTNDITFLASDAESGIQYVELYYRLDGGDWTLYSGTYTASPISFDTAGTGGSGYYEFYTLATDNNGNSEAPPETPDYSVQIMNSFAGTRVYVDADATGSFNGLDWANALTKINDALIIAEGFGIGEVWVAEGTYTESVIIVSNAEVYGGFGGTETVLTERDIIAHQTVIDASTADNGQPAYHGVLIDTVSNVRLDGFTITGGEADGNSTETNCGGGIWGHSLDQTTEIANCTIVGNYGTGICLNASSPLITDSVIIENQGGGIAAWYNSSTVIFGSTIRNNTGSGINFNSSIVIEDCLIIGNSNWGLYASSGSALINRSTIAGNYGNSNNGGGIYSQSVTITNSSISGNRGPGLYTWNSESQVVNSLISGNSGGANGGGISFHGGDISIRNCTIADNEGDMSGGIYMDSYINSLISNTIFAGNNNVAIYELEVFSDPHVRSCLFYDNPDGDYFDHSDIYGIGEGTIYTGANAINLNIPEAESNISGDPQFIPLASGTWSAAPVYNEDDQTTTLTDGSASFAADSLVGQLINVDTSQKLQAYILTNTATTITVVGDHTSYAGNSDAYEVLDYHLPDGSAALDRGDLSGAPGEDFEGDPRPGSDGLIDIGFDEADAAYLPPADTAPPESNVLPIPVVTTSRTMEIPFASSDAETGVAQYVELYYSKDGGEWTLYPGQYTTSPIIFDTALTGGSGRYEFYTRAFDAAGNPEPAPSAADGYSAVIYSFTGDRVYVDINAAGLESGLDWENGFHSVAAGLIIAEAFGVPEIWVADGTYPEALVLPANIELYGGFAGTETLLTERDYAANPTIIDGSTDAGGSPALHVVRIQDVADVLLDGFTVTGGEAVSSATWDGDLGGGIVISGTSGTIRIANCTISGNYADSMGAGMYIEEAFGLEIDNCIFADNTVDGDGAGLYIYNGSYAAVLKVSDCIFENNYAYSDGGAAFIEDAIIELTGCTIRSNTAEDRAGGIYFYYASGVVSDCDISGNTAIDGEGGGLYIDTDYYGRPAMHIENSRITNNTAYYGGGIYAEDTKPEIDNTIIAGNRADSYGYGSGGGLYFDWNSDPHISNSIIAGNQAMEEGGGINIYYSNFIIRDSIISGNDGGEYGGGISAYSQDNSLPHSPQFINTIVSGNRADYGAALFLDRVNPQVINSTISSNSATTDGGGIYLARAALPVVTNSVFDNNTMHAVFEADSDSDAVLSYSLFFANADGDYYDLDTAVTLTGAVQINTLAESTNTMDGAPSYIMGPAGSWTAAPVYDTDTNITLLTDGSASFAENSLTNLLINADTGQGRQTLVASNTATTISVWGDVTDYIESGESYQVIDYHLGSGSAAIDTGTDATAPSTDLDGNPRPIDVPATGADETGTEFDLGVYEYQQVDDLFILPAQFSFVSQGHESGPFSPEQWSFELQNLGSGSINWTAAVSETWMQINQASGSLAAGESVFIVLSLTPEAETLGIGVYPGTLSITNTTNGYVQQRNVELQVSRDYFTEIFTATDNDISYQTLVFTPDGSENFYSLCRRPAGSFPTDPSGGTVLSFTDSDARGITIQDGALVPFFGQDYGQNYNFLYIGSNGWIGFGNYPCISCNESLTLHFSYRLISAMFDDLNPAAGGRVSWKQLGDRVVVTFENVPGKNTLNSNSFQVEMFFDGVITITHLGIAVQDGLVGISDGQGVPTDFIESNLNGYACSQGAAAFSGSVFSCSDLVPLSLSDNDLAGDGTAGLTVTSSSGDTESVTLTEAIDVPGIFSGTILTEAGSAAPGDGILQVSGGDLLTATYNDDNDGTGSPAIVTAEAGIDCTAPAVTDISTSILAYDKADITVTSDEPVTILIHYGSVEGLLNLSKAGNILPQTTQTISLTGLSFDTEYFFSVAITDAVGNTTLDDNGGAYYTLTTQSLPNLTASDLQIPGAAATGQSIPVSFWVNNIGEEMALRYWNDYLYLSYDDQPGSDITIAPINRSADLPVGESYQIVRNVTLPPVPAGVYWIVAVADGGRSVTELDETDNATVAGPIAIGQPNLVISNLVAPEQAYAGGQIQVSWTVTNSGNDLAAGPWYDYVVVSQDQVLSSNDSYLKQVVHSNLAVGAQYDENVTVTLPSHISGDYYIIVITDRNYVVNETDETDNIAVSTVMNIGQPNLTINSVSAPADVVIGQSFTVTWNVTNTGNVPVASSYYDRVYLSTDDQPGEDDIFLSSTLHDTVVGPGSSYEGNSSVSIPGVTADQYWLVINVDNFNYIGETSETDNTLVYGPINVTGPDLVVSDLATQPEMYTGEEVTINWTVLNSGSGPASGNWYDMVYLSTDDQVGDDESLNIWVPHTAGLDSGASYDVAAPLTVPSVAAGTYWLIVVTDPQHSIVEVNENNNYRTFGPITIQRPNLSLSNVQTPVEAWTRQDYSISWTVTNTGTVPTVRTWKDGIYLSLDDQFGDDTELTAIDCPAILAAGQFYDRGVTVTIPELPSGDYWFIIKTDSNTVIPETDEADNIIAIGPIPVRTTPYANLQVSLAEFAVPEVNIGGQFVVDWQVSNVGTGPTSASYWKDRVYLSVDEELDGTDRMIGERNNISFLNNGENYASTAVVTAWGVSEGDYYVLVVTDATNEVYEYQAESDNVTSAGQIHVSLPPPVDFIVTSVVAPPLAFSGQPFPMTYQVENIGVDIGDTVYWYDDVYLSEDTILDTASDRRIARLYRYAATSRNPESPFNISYTANIQPVPPVGVSGTFYVFVVTDATNRINEWAFENNNSAYDESPISITLTPPPDLEVTAMTPSGDITAGRPFTLSYAVLNSGSTRTPNDRWTDAFYLSTDEILDMQTDILLLQRTVTFYGDPGGLDVDEVYSRDETLTPPVDISAGDYTLFVVTDRFDQVFELDNVNNIGLETISIESRPPDLIVSAISGDSEAEAGKALTLRWSVRNQGIGDSIVSSWNDRIMMTRNDTVGDGDDISLGTFTHNGRLDPNQSYEATGTVTVPFSLSGSYYAYVRTDINLHVFEGAAGESNNVSDLYPVTITRHIPDLKMSGTSFTTENGRISVQWIVENIGENRTNTNYWYDRIVASTNGVFGDEDDLQLHAAPHSGYLEPASSYLSIKNFLLPASISNDVYLFVETNSDRRVDEGGLYENNVMEAGLLTAAAIDEMRTVPDLVVDSVAAPLEAVSGQLFDLSWTVKNVGEFIPHAAPFPPEVYKGAWIDRIYLSRDTFLDPAVDTYLGQQSIYAGELTDVTEGEDSYQTYSKTASFRVPDGLTGPFYVIVSVDRSNLVTEQGGEDNNNGFDSQAMLVSLAPMADMVVGTITIPADVAVGSRLTLEYTLENLSDYDVTGDWWDLYYLSTDAEIDIDDVELGIYHRDASTTPLPAHGSVDISTYFNLPGVLPGEYYVILYTDAFNQIRETDDLNNIGISGSQVSIDMENLEKSYPDGSVPIDVDLLWLNRGSDSFLYRFEAADGESLTLSPEWLPTESTFRHTRVSAYVALDRVPTPEDYDYAETDFLISGKAGPVSSAPLTMSGLAAGDYYVRLDLQTIDMQEDQFPVSESFDLVIDPIRTITEIAVEINVELMKQWKEGFYYYFDTSAGRTLMLQPEWLWLNRKTSYSEYEWYDRRALTRVYVAYDRIASPYDYDFSEEWFLYSNGYDEPNLVRPLIIPKTKEGSYYLFVEVQDAHSPWVEAYYNGIPITDHSQERFNVVLSELPFSVLGVEPAGIGNAGRVTLEVIASNLDLCSTVELVQSGQVIRTAEDLMVPDYEEPKGYARFDMEGVEPGSYEIRVTDLSGAVASRPVSVYNGRGPQIGARLRGPTEVRWSDYIFYVNYGNSGDADGIPPLLVVQNLGSNSFEIERDDLTSEAVPGGATIQLLGIGHDGPAGVLRPGELGSIPIFFRTVFDDGDFRLQVITAEDTRPLVFEEIENQIRPSDVTDEEWAEIRPQLVAMIGSTWGSYVRALAEMATYMGEYGYRSFVVADIFRMLYQKAAVNDHSTLRGYLYEESLCRPLNEGRVYVYDAAGNLADTGTVGDNLRYRVDLEPGSYLLAAEADGFARSVIEDVAVTGDTGSQYNIRMAPEAVIIGNVHLNAPVPADPRLTIIARENEQSAEVGTYPAEITGDAFTVRGLAPGMYDLRFTAEEYLPETVTGIAVTVGATVDIGQVTLNLAASVSGTIVNSVPGLSSDEIMVGAFTAGELIAAATVDIDGNFSLSGLVPGMYEFKLFDPEGRAHSPAEQIILGYGDTITGVELNSLPGGTITGVVADNLAVPISGLGVFLIDSSGEEFYAVTDEAGSYEFTSLGLSTYKVALASAGAAFAQTIEVTDLDGGSYTTNFTVTSTASIGGIVSYSDGSPAKGAAVSIFENDYYIGTAVTDQLGHYFFKILRPGGFELRTSAGNASFAPASVTVSAGGSYTQNFTAGTGSMQVSVSAGDSELEGTIVLLSDADGIVAKISLESDGIGLFDNLVPGDYTIEAFGPDNKGGKGQITIYAGQTVLVNLELIVKAKVSGNLYVDSLGGSTAPVVIIYFRNQADPDKSYAGISEDNGAYAVEYLDPGTYDAVISGTGFEQTIHTGISVTGDTVMDLVVNSASVFLTGRLVDSSGHPLPVAYVSVYDADGLPLGDCRVVADGTFSVEGLTADDLALAITADGYLSREITGISAAAGTNVLGDIVIEPVVHSSAYGPPSSVAVGSPQTASWQDLFVTFFTQEIVDIIYQLCSSPNKSSFHVEEYSLTDNNMCINELCYGYYLALAQAKTEQDTAWTTADHTAAEIFGYKGEWDARLTLYMARLTLDIYGLFRGQAALQALNAVGAGRVFWSASILDFIQAFDNWVVRADDTVKAAKNAATADEELQRAGAAITFFLDMQRDLDNLSLPNLRAVITALGLGGTNPPGNIITAVKIFGVMRLAKRLTVDLAELMNQLYDLTYLIDVRMDDYEQKYDIYLTKAGTAHYRLVQYERCRRSPEARQCPDDDGDPDGDPDSDPDPDGDGDGGTGGSSSNPPNPPPNPNPDNDPYNPQYVQSADPNDIIGPAGYGEERWVSSQDTLPYIIRFENMADATAPAQRVVITQQLDADLDYRTFKVTDFGWGDQYIEVNSGLPYYLGRIDLVNGSGLVVDVFATVDVISGTATWVLETIDPATGEPPEDALAGFLPPNDENGVGEGFVSYTIRPRSDAATWSVIDATATIVFDTNEPIDTPPIFNTIDAVAPTSSVSEATNEYWTTNIFVSWAGEDDSGSALQDYNVYVSTDGGPYVIWLEHTDLTSAWFVGEQNHTYTFYSVARDHAGNVEAFPSAPDAEAEIPVYEYETGDLNHDLEVNLADAIIAMKVMSHVPVAGTIYVEEDVNGDGRIGTAELVYILQKIAGLR